MLYLNWTFLIDEINFFIFWGICTANLDWSWRTPQTWTNEYVDSIKSSRQNILSQKDGAVEYATKLKLEKYINYSVICNFLPPSAIIHTETCPIQLFKTIRKKNSFKSIRFRLYFTESALLKLKMIKFIFPNDRIDDSFMSFLDF